MHDLCQDFCYHEKQNRADCEEIYSCIILIEMRTDNWILWAILSILDKKCKCVLFCLRTLCVWFCWKFSMFFCLFSVSEKKNQQCKICQLKKCLRLKIFFKQIKQYFVMSRSWSCGLELINLTCLVQQKQKRWLKELSGYLQVVAAFYGTKLKMDEVSDFATNSV